MGTTLVGAMRRRRRRSCSRTAGDSRAYLVRDGIAMQLTEDHTLLARLLAAGVDVDIEGEGARFKSMLTNALGIGQECKVSTFVVPLADGDRFLLCSDGITEYVKEAEIGEVLAKMPSPARAAQRLVELALERGGGDNATALVVRVLEAGETARPREQLRKRRDGRSARARCGRRSTPQQRLRALRIALPRDHAAGEKLPAQTLGDRVAWIIIEGERRAGRRAARARRAASIPRRCSRDRPLPDKDGARGRADRGPRARAALRRLPRAVRGRSRARREPARSARRRDREPRRSAGCQPTPEADWRDARPPRDAEPCRTRRRRSARGNDARARRSVDVAARADAAAHVGAAASPVRRSDAGRTDVQLPAPPTDRRGVRAATEPPARCRDPPNLRAPTDAARRDAAAPAERRRPARRPPSCSRCRSPLRQRPRGDAAVGADALRQHRARRRRGGRRRQGADRAHRRRRWGRGRARPTRRRSPPARRQIALRRSAGDQISSRPTSRRRSPVAAQPARTSVRARDLDQRSPSADAAELASVPIARPPRSQRRPTTRRDELASRRS